LEIRKAETGIERITGFKITIPGNPYFFFKIIIRLFFFVNVFLLLLSPAFSADIFLLEEKYLFQALIITLEIKTKIITPKIPPRFVNIRVSMNDIFIIITATGKVAANFQVDDRIINISFIKT
jgi:hypothetical protein